MTASIRVLDRARHAEPDGRDGWRRWLERNHATATGVWLVRRRRSTGRGGLDYNTAIEEALSFGWVDGQAAGVDEQRLKLYFAPRRARSPWSKLNKERYQRMLQAGRVAPAGVAAVERAKSDGSWSVLDPVERLEVPADLAAALDAHEPTLHNWEAFPPSARRALLAWIAMARREETRARASTRRQPQRRSTREPSSAAAWAAASFLLTPQDMQTPVGSVLNQEFHRFGRFARSLG